LTAKGIQLDKNSKVQPKMLIHSRQIKMGIKLVAFSY